MPSAVPIATQTMARRGAGRCPSLFAAVPTPSSIALPAPVPDAMVVMPASRSARLDVKSVTGMAAFATWYKAICAPGSPASRVATNAFSPLRISGVDAAPSGDSAVSTSTTTDSGSLAGTASTTSSLSFSSVMTKSAGVSAAAGRDSSAATVTSASFSFGPPETVGPGLAIAAATTAPAKTRRRAVTAALPPRRSIGAGSPASVPCCT